MTFISNSLVVVRGLGKSYTRRRPISRKKYVVRAFEAVDLKIRRCSTLALVGESGAGKSSLARCLALLEKPSGGEIWYEGRSLTTLSKKDLFPLRREIQYIFQEPAESLNSRFTAREIIAEPLRIQREGTPAQQDERALALMELVGLSPDGADKRASEFSGGQKQRLAIARALALEPKLLILDESLSSLDPANQDMILALLAELQSSHSLTYLHISHDLQLVSRFADEVAVMHEGQILEQQSARALFSCPVHEHTRELLEAMPALEAILEELSA